MNLLVYHYDGIKSFYKKNLRLIFPLTILFFIAVIVIFSIVVSMNPGLATRLLMKTNDSISTAMNPAGLLPTIAQNAFTSLVLILLGCIPFLFIPIIFVAYNASVIGILFGATSISNVTPGLIYASILPHGIFLIPAMLLSATCGIYLCKCVILHLLKKKQIVSFTKLFLQIGRIYGLLILPLLILAAIVQMLITPLVISLL